MAEGATQGATQEATGGATRGATQEATQGVTQEATQEATQGATQGVTREVTAAEPQPTQPSASANTLALILMEATPAVATLTEAILAVATLAVATLTEATLTEAIAGAAWADFVQRLAPTRMAALALTLTEARARTGSRCLALQMRAATQSPRCPTSL